jgi:hypothetical protein
LAIYHEQTKPLVGHYREAAQAGAVRFASIDGIGAVEEITQRTLEALHIKHGLRFQASRAPVNPARLDLCNLTLTGDRNDNGWQNPL